ncbi:hypothetical protein IKN40_01105 [bacterium]|nr:hypothetical protein [bacterium]
MNKDQQDIIDKLIGSNSSGCDESADTNAEHGFQKNARWGTFVKRVKAKHPTFKETPKMEKLFNGLRNKVTQDAVDDINIWIKWNKATIDNPKVITNSCKWFLDELFEQWKDDKICYLDKDNRQFVMREVALQTDAPPAAANDKEETSEIKIEYSDDKDAAPTAAPPASPIVKSPAPEFTSSKNMPANKKVVPKTPAVADDTNEQTAKSVRFETPTPKSQKQVAHYTSRNYLKTLSYEDQILVLESCKSYLEDHKTTSKTYIKLYESTISKLEAAGTLSPTLVNAYTNYNKMVDTQDDIIKMYESSIAEQKSKLEELKARRKSLIEQRESSKVEVPKVADDAATDKPMTVSELDTNDDGKLDIKDLSVTQEQYERELGIIDSEIKELTATISDLDSKLESAKNAVTPEAIDDVIGDKVEQPKPKKKEVPVNNPKSPITTSKKKAKPTTDDAPGNDANAPVDTAKPERDNPQGYDSNVIKDKELRRRLQGSEDILNKNIELATSYFDYKEYKDFSDLKYKTLQNKDQIINNPQAKQAKLIYLAVSKYMEHLGQLRDYGVINAATFRQEKQRIIDHLNERYFKLGNEFGFRLYPGKLNSLAIEIKDLDGKKFEYRVKKNYVNQNAPNKDTFFQYNMADIFSIIEEFMNEDTDFKFKLSTHAKNAIESIINKSVEGFKKEAEDKGFVVHHAIAHGTDIEYSSLIKLIEKYINSRKNSHIKMKFQLPLDAKTKIVEVIKKEQQHYSHGLSEYYNDLNQKSSNILARIGSLRF